MWCGVANFSVKSDKISEMQQFLMYDYILWEAGRYLLLYVHKSRMNLGTVSESREHIYCVV